MRFHRTILGYAAIAMATGCQAWHEPPLEPVAVVGPPVEFEGIGPPMIIDTPGAVASIDSEIVISPPMNGMPWDAGPAEWGVVPSGRPIGLQNPLFVPVSNHDAAWREVVDVVDDYFQIAREEPVHAYGGVLTEGRIATRPLSGATQVEPHRCDSVGRFNRWESTFQTIRRTAHARVVPTNGGFLIEMIVEKELEDLPRPEHATAGAATFRTDGSLRRSRTEPTDRSKPSEVWIGLGRDSALEQQMLAEIRERLDVAPPGVVY